MLGSLRSAQLKKNKRVKKCDSSPYICMWIVFHALVAVTTVSASPNRTVMFPIPYTHTHTQCIHTLYTERDTTHMCMLSLSHTQI